MAYVFYFPPQSGFLIRGFFFLWIRSRLIDHRDPFSLSASLNYRFGCKFPTTWGFRETRECSSPSLGGDLFTVSSNQPWRDLIDFKQLPTKPSYGISVTLLRRFFCFEYIFRKLSATRMFFLKRCSVKRRKIGNVFQLIERLESTGNLSLHFPWNALDHTSEIKFDWLDGKGDFRRNQARRFSIWLMFRPWISRLKVRFSKSRDLKRKGFSWKFSRNENF